MHAKDITEARRLAQSGEAEKAASIYEQILSSSSDRNTLTECHGFLGGWHFHGGRPEKAIFHFERCAGLIDPHPALEYDLGQAHEAAGDMKAALEHYMHALKLMPGNARYYLYAGHALNTLGHEDQALALWSLGSDIDPIMRNASAHPDADNDLKDKSAEADRALRRHFTELHASTVGDDDALQRVKNAVWPQTHTGSVEYLNDMQKPYIFYMPDLPAIPVFENLPWAAAIESMTEVILGEYLAAAGATKGAPYVPSESPLGAEWAPLKGKDAWRSIHLFQEGKRVEEVAPYFKETCAAIEAAPLAKMSGEPLEVFFSVLEAGAHIPPHYGLANCRMTVHLPLIVPDNCGIRVAENTYQWTKGNIFAFDDSFIHEAWNHSAETRVVLIFEAWPPTLTPEEQRGISDSFAARAAWLDQRKIPD